MDWQREIPHNRLDADIYIHPSMPDTDVTSFGNKKSAIMIQQGEDAARKQLPQIYKFTLPQL